MTFLSLVKHICLEEMKVKLTKHVLYYKLTQRILIVFWTQTWTPVCLYRAIREVKLTGPEANIHKYLTTMTDALIEQM